MSSNSALSDQSNQPREASDPTRIEMLVDELQRAFKVASGSQPSNEEHIRRKWRAVACHILAGYKEKVDAPNLAVELHGIFIGIGHRTELLHRAKDDPVWLGWCGVAHYILHVFQP